MKRYVNSGLESAIERNDTIGSQEENALVVSVTTSLEAACFYTNWNLLKLAKEYSYKSIALKIMQRSLLQEDIGLVDQDYGTPDCSKVKNRFQNLFHLHGARPG